MEWHVSDPFLLILSFYYLFVGHSRLGFVQRGEAESIFQPIPLGMEAAGQFEQSYPIYESGFGTLSLVRYPEKKYKDLSRSLFDFSLSFSVVFLIIFLMLAIVVNRTFCVKFDEAVQIIYRIALKGTLK